MAAEPQARPPPKLPRTRQSVTPKFSVAGFDGYITGSVKPASRGEIFTRS